MSDDYQMDGFSPMDDDRTVAMPPVGDASPMTMGVAAIALPGDEEKQPNAKLPWIITLSVIGALLVLAVARSEEHTSELQSPVRISYAVFCLKKKK